MDEFRPSFRPADRDGRNIEIIDAKTLKYINKVYIGRSLPLFDPSPFDQKPVGEKKKSQSSTSIMSWWNEPKMKRKRRLTKYKMMAFEGKLRESLKKGRRWIKKRYSMLVHGY